MERMNPDYDVIQSEYAQVAIISHALLEVKQPNFKAFLNYFTLTKKEKTHMLEYVLSEHPLFDVSLDKLNVFLEHFDLAFSEVLNTQLKSLQEWNFNLDFHAIFKNKETLNERKHLFEKKSDKLDVFLNTDFIIYAFDALDDFFNLEQGHEFFLHFLKMSTYYGQDISDKQIIKNLYDVLIECNINEDKFEVFTKSIEKTLLCYSMDDDNISKKTKKIKI
jgi:hypothetical protein